MNCKHTFHDFEHQGWEHAAAQYEDSFAPVAGLFIQSLVDCVLDDTPSKLLDIACGTGNAGAYARQRGAAVTGIDFSHAMLALARSRHSSIDFVQASADNLPLADSSFDAALINFGVNHFAVPVTALREARRVVRPGGKIAFTVWGDRASNIAWQLVLRAIDMAGDPNIRLPTPPQGAVNQLDVCHRLLIDSGFAPSQCHVKTIQREWVVPSAAYLLKVLSHGTVRMAGLVNAQASTSIKAIAETLDTLIQGHARCDQQHPATCQFHLPVTAHLASARRD